MRSCGPPSERSFNASGLLRTITGQVDNDHLGNRGIRQRRPAEGWQASRNSRVVSRPKPRERTYGRRFAPKVNRHRRFSTAKWAMRSEDVERLDAIVPLLQPRDLVDQSAWLFDEHYPEILGRPVHRLRGLAHLRP